MYKNKTERTHYNLMYFISKVLLNVICFFLSLTTLFPMFWLFYSSLKTKNEFLLNTIALPKKINISNYPIAFRMGNLSVAMGNSLFYVIVNIIIVSVSAIVVAYFMSRYEFKGKRVIRYFYLLGILIPVYALIIPVFLQYRLLNLINNRITLLITYYAMEMPLSMFLYESFIDGIPVELDEAATLDGCSIFKKIMLILFPLCRPIMATCSILVALHTWNEFAFASILTSAVKLRTVSVAVRSYSSGHEIEYTYLMAGLFSVALPLLIIYVFFSKYIVKGMTVGAIKG